MNLQNKAGYTPIMLAALAEAQTEEERKSIQLLLSKGNVNLAASQVSSSFVFSTTSPLLYPSKIYYVYGLR